MEFLVLWLGIGALASIIAIIDSVLSGDGVTIGDVLGYSVVFPLFGVFSLSFCVCWIGKERFGWFFNKEVIKKKKRGRRE